MKIFLDAFLLFCAFFSPFIVSDAVSWSLGICEVANQREL